MHGGGGRDIGVLRNRTRPCRLGISRFCPGVCEPFEESEKLDLLSTGGRTRHAIPVKVVGVRFTLHEVTKRGTTLLLALGKICTGWVSMRRESASDWLPLCLLSCSSSEIGCEGGRRFGRVLNVRNHHDGMARSDRTARTVLLAPKVNKLAPGP